MATQTLTPYINNTQQITLTLASTGAEGSNWMVSGRDMSLPYRLEIRRKAVNPNSKGNDRVSLRLARSERNVTTGLLATGSISMTVSVPKDSATITQTHVKEMVAAIASLLDNCTAQEATNPNIAALVEGRDF
jgi:hypothetical protein